MTKADRANLERLARKRARLAKSTIGERVKMLKAEVEDQLAAEYQIDDELWADLTRRARAEVAKADAGLVEACQEAGIPSEFRPALSLQWYGRGTNALASRRAELRKLAHARLDAAAETAKVAVDTSLLGVETELIRDGLESAQALAFIDAMPTPEQLVAPVDLHEIEQPPSPRWKPAADAAAALLSPTTASDRANKRQAVARVLAASPDASDRAVARLAGVDHKTVGKLRSAGGETPQASGETPQGGWSS